MIGVFGMRRCRDAAGLALVLCLHAQGVEAAMDDAFMRAEPVGAGPVGTLAVLAYDTGGLYRGAHAGLGYKFSPSWSVTARYWYRDWSYSAARAALHSWQLATDYGILDTPAQERRLTLRLSAWGDYAASLAKPGTTLVQGAAFQQVSLAHPHDTQVQADLVYTAQPLPHHSLTGFVGGGYGWVRAGDIEAVVQQGPCRYKVRIGNDNVARGTLAQPCVVGRVPIRDATLRLDASQYGLRPREDFNYGAAFVGLGGSWRWQHGGFGVGAAYHFQALFRDGKERLAAYGAPQLQRNHVLGLEFSYAPARSFEVFVRAQGYKSSLVGYVPLLYNPATAKQLDRNYASGMIGVRLALW